ncbi:MAG: GNAT family N-acetyltransferase [Phycisphaerales bacterium]|nr:GNAT family N-acetyltransferase [Phycisphaerales bacterium]
MPFLRARGEYLVSDDPSLLDLEVWHRFLSTSYWSPGIPPETFRRAATNSLCIGLYERDADATRMIGGGRIITDRATYAYLADVFVLEERRGRGLGVWLIESIIEHPDLQGLRRFCLMTRDAHGLYTKFGFAPMRDPTRYLERHDPEVYARAAVGQPGQRNQP